MTITRRIGFENLIPFPSLNRDADGNGVADGWTAITSANATSEHFVDVEGSQAINILESTGQAFPGCRTTDRIPVVAGRTYTVSAEMRGEGALSSGSTGTGPRLQIKWYDSSGIAIGDVFQPVQSVQPDVYTRTSVTGTAPANATSADVRIIFRVQEAGKMGAVWFRNVQLQSGSTMTDYEPNDFFTVVNVAPTYSSGWSIAEVDGNRVFRSESLAAGATSWSGGQLKFEVPKEADDDSSIQLRVDTSRISSGEQLLIFVNGTLFRTINGGAIPSIVGLTPSPRGTVVMTLQHRRPSDGTSNGQFVTIDNVSVEWAEILDPPRIMLPDAQVVKYLDFESEEYDPFFQIANTAPGYTYGFERSFRIRSSGYYSYTVKDTADSGGVDEIGRPPTIPDGAKAGALIVFNVPVTAIDPVLSFKARHRAQTGDIGRVYINGQVVWEAVSGFSFDDVSVVLAPGNRIEMLIEYEKDASGYARDDAIYIDDIIVSYNIPRKPYMVISTAPETEIRTESKSFSLIETFESSKVAPFFTVTNPSRIDSPSTPTPTKGWLRSTQKAYAGNYGFRALLGLENGQSSAADFTFRVPLGVKNPRVRFRSYVGTKRAVSALSGERYPRLYGEYRIWINRSTCWKEMNFASPSLNSSVPYSTGDSGSTANDFACPWGKWWQETIELTPGRTYTLTFEYYLRSSGSTKTTSQNVMAIDNLQVTWEEAAGDVLTVPAEPLIYLDNREGYRWVDERGGAEMTGLSFNEYEVYGEPGSTYQNTRIDPRMVDLIVRINGQSREDLRQKIRELTTKISNRPLALQLVYPEGNVRSLLCRFAPSGDWRESYGDNIGVWWRKVLLSFRAFEPFWYGAPRVVDGLFEPDRRWFMVNNPGDAQAWPFIRIYGPITNPKVDLTPSNMDPTVLASFRVNVTLPAGSYIVVDTRPGKKAVILDNGTSLYQWLTPTSQLFSIPRGEYGLRLTGTGTDANTRLIAEYSPPYWGV